MLKWRKILVPIDFSPGSRAAMNAAVELAARLDAEVTLLHTYEPPGWVLPDGFIVAGPDKYDQVTTAIETSLAAWKASAMARAKVAVTATAVLGTAFREIVKMAKEGSFDVIVMSTHGRTGFEHALLGSVAEKVLRLSPCPVLTIRGA